MVTIALYAKQKKRHRCTEQTLGLCGRRRAWDDLREQHWNKYTIKGETDHQPRLDAWDKCSGLVHWEDPEVRDGEGGGRGTHVNPWLIHVNVWQKPLQYCKVISLHLIKINEKKKKKKLHKSQMAATWKCLSQTLLDTVNSLRIFRRKQKSNPKQMALTILQAFEFVTSATSRIVTDR